MIPWNLNAISDVRLINMEDLAHNQIDLKLDARRQKVYIRIKVVLKGLLIFVLETKTL